VSKNVEFTGTAGIRHGETVRITGDQVETLRKADKVCIVGFSRSKLRAANHVGDDDWEIWGFNDPHPETVLSLAYFDRWFQLHSQDYLATHWPPWRGDRQMWAKQRRIPVYMQQADPDIPMSVEFPRARIHEYFRRGDYHQSTLDWLVAYAVFCEFEHIELAGVGTMSLGISEPLSSRAALEYWIGVAEGAGITVDLVGDESDLFKTYQLLETKRQYAWDESRPVIRRSPGQ